MAQIKDTAAIAEKWARVTPGRTSEYQQGVQQPRTSWSTAAANAEERYKTGVTEAAAQGRFGRGVKAAGDSAWQSAALAKGPARFAEGVAIAQPDFAAGFGPYADTIRSTQLPPRFARGDPRNIKRVEVVAMALRKKKTGQ